MVNEKDRGILMEITELRKEDEKAWDSYVHKSPISTFYHQIGWKNVVEKTYKHKPIYSVAKEEGEIQGILPLFLMKSVIFGKKLVSVPFAPYGGVCADNQTIENALIEEAKRITKEYGADYLELRNLTKINENEYSTNCSYITFIINLNQGLDSIWKKMARDKKKGVKKARKRNLEVNLGTKNIDAFYNVYVQNMRNLGTPVHDYDFFKNILLEFSNDIRILTIWYENNVICGKFLLSHKDVIISMWGSTLKEYQKYHPYDLANWEAIEYSYEKGYKYFDFGRCLHNSGVFQYKEAWATENKQLYYQFYLNNAKNPPDITQFNPSRQRFANIWKKLPVPMTKIIGPTLRRNFP